MEYFQAVGILEAFIKHQFIKKMKNYAANFNIKIAQFVRRNNEKTIHWYLGVNEIKNDQIKATLGQETNPVKRIKRISHTFANNIRLRQQAQKIVDLSLTQLPRPQSRKSNIQQKQVKQSIQQSVNELRSTHSSHSQKQVEDPDEEVINRLRERKTQREQFKSRMLRDEQTIRRSRNQFVPRADKLKIQKINDKSYTYDHFIDMEITIDSQIQTQKQKLKTKQNQYQKNKNKNKLKKIVRFVGTSSQHAERTNKKKATISLFQKQKCQPLVIQQRTFPLSTPTSFRSFRSQALNYCQNYQNSNNSPEFSLANNTMIQKKLQFLKNSQLNPKKIKLSELINYKKMETSANNITLCSSMKTVKNIIESSVSIDSKQFMQDPVNASSHRLIRVVNRNLYQEMILDTHINRSFETMDIQKAANLKSKKQNKVRFNDLI